MEYSVLTSSGLHVLMGDEDCFVLCSKLDDKRPYMPVPYNMRKCPRWGFFYSHVPFPTTERMTQEEFDEYTWHQDQGGVDVKCSNASVWELVRQAHVALDGKKVEGWDSTVFQGETNEMHCRENTHLTLTSYFAQVKKQPRQK